MCHNLRSGILVNPPMKVTMVVPVSYVFKSENGRAYSYHKQWEKQKPPYNLRLWCRLWYAQKVGSYDSNSASWATDEKDSPLRVKVQNKARERLIAALGDTAQIGASIAAEWRGSVSMISSRALQLLRFSRAVRKGHLNDAATILGLDRVKATLIKQSVTRKGYAKRRKNGFAVRDFGSVWLEYSYGWAPLVSDIYGSCQIIDKPPRNITVHGRASDSMTFQSRYGTSPNFLVTDHVWKHKCHMIADIKVTNPNLYLSNQLGLTNPAQWLLEGIPFSFVLDWFSNLSQWVSQLTDFLGMDLIQPQTSDLVFYNQHNYLDYSSVIYEREWKEFTCLTRNSGIPSVQLLWGYEVPNWKRGLNAISLLTQFLGRKS